MVASTDDAAKGAAAGGCGSAQDDRVAEGRRVGVCGSATAPDSHRRTAFDRLWVPEAAQKLMETALAASPPPLTR